MPDFDDDHSPLNVEIVPELGQADVTGRLARSFRFCSSFRAAVAFWTIDHQRVSPVIDRRLSEDGFLCVDINSPTDLDRIAGLAADGANVYLHLRSPSNQIEDTDAGNYAMPKHLMHAKFLLFDLPDGIAEIWTGSHNWTRRSLLGPNIELSTILTVSRHSEIYRIARDNLNMIRSLCVPFRHEHLDYYKFLQRSERSKAVPVIELEGADVNDLSQTSVELFGTDAKDLGELDSTNRQVILAITDSKAKPERTHLYIGRIIQSGLLVRANPLADGIAFTERRHAFRTGRRYPVLLAASRPDDVLNQAIYFVTIEIQDQITGRANVLSLPEPSQHWRKSDHDPLIERMNPSDRVSGKGKKVIVRVPANGNSPDEMFDPLRQTHAVSIEDKRAYTDANLVIKRILVDKERNPISIAEANELPG